MTGGGIYDRGANWLFGSDLRPGERHPVMRLKSGKYRPGRFMGPGSHVLDRLREGQRGISPVDDVSARHDLAYALAKNENDIRIADEHMLARIKEIEDGRHGGDTRWNINLGRGGISSKIFLEDKVGVPKKWFTNFGDIDDKDREFAQEKYDKLTQEGFGRKRKKQSGGSLGGGDWIAHVKACQRKHGCSYREAMKRASKTYKK